MARESIVVCRLFTVEWGTICQLARAVRKSGLLGTYELEVHARVIYCAMIVDFLARAYKNLNKGRALLKLLRLTRQYMATDALDKVFALIGVVTDIDSIGFN